MQSTSPIPLLKSIAVLPFVNISNDPENEYFSDGITEEIINALTKIDGLKVIARTSSFAFKNTQMDVRTIGNQLDVTTILEGSVRKAGNRIRITAQLIQTEDGSHLWAQNFDRKLDDLFALQDEVSLLIADQIREHYGHFNISAPIEAATPPLLEAYDLVLKGNYHFKRKSYDDIKKAVQYFEDAIAKDPNFEEAYTSLGETYFHVFGFGMLSMEEAYKHARNAADKAISINPRSARAHKVLAYIRFFHDWDWDGAIQAYQSALEYGLPEQNEFIGYYAMFIEEDFEKAIRIAKEVLSTDPLHVLSHWQLGLCYYFARQFEKAIDAFSGAIEIDPNYGEALRFRGLIQGYLGNFVEAKRDIHKALDCSGGQGLANMDLLMVNILMGKNTEVLRTLQQTNFLDTADTASIYSMLNKPEEAIEWLEKAYQERSGSLLTLKNFWVWDNIRDHDRFKQIYAQMKFPKSVIINSFSPTSGRQIKMASNQPLLSDKEVSHFQSLLDILLNEDEIFLDPNLTLRILAAQLELHPNKLSWLLNEQMGRNFNEFINSYRLKTFKSKALNPKNNHLTLLALAYESGFNSKTVFNSFFKKIEGTTPRKWVKANQE